jgi:predicted nuclease of predicted toxin-antitoxin system
MKILIDMNLSPTWVSVLEKAGHTASHWSNVGSLNAPDREILLWAKANGYLLFTILDKFAENLLQGALISVDEEKSRVRLLPLRKDKTE